MDPRQNSNVGRGATTPEQAQGTPAERLRQAVTAAAAGAGSRDEVQDAARALVSELRGRHEPPEQMLIQMKTLLADAGLRGGYPTADDDGSRDPDALYREIITWSIRAYYEGRT